MYIMLIDLGIYLFTVIISIIIIYLGHQLWNYIKDNYSTKKTKDLVTAHPFSLVEFDKITKELYKNNYYV